MSTPALQSAPSPRSYTTELLVLAFPIIAMTVSRMLMGFIDFVMISQLGDGTTAAQAAISPATLFVFAVGCVGLGIANAVQTFVAQAEGRGKPEEAGSYGWQSLYIAAAFGLLAVPVALTTRMWFGVIAEFGQLPPDVATLEIQYIEIGLWSLAPSIVCIGLNGFFNGVQKPWVTVIAVVASLVTNAFGNWLLIYGNWGFPRLEVAGAAYATVFGWGVRAAVLGGAMLLPTFNARYHTRRTLAPHWSRLKDLLRVGLPISVNWLVDIGSWTVFMMLIIPRFETIAMAATNIGMQLMHLSFMPAIGFGIALCSQVGFAIGAGRPDEAVARTRVAFRLTGGYMTAVGVLFLLFGGVLTALFNDNPDVVAAGRRIMMWAALFQLFDAMSITYMNALRGAGDTRWPAVVTAVYCWVVFICSGWLLAKYAPQFGVNGPWSMCALYIILLGSSLRWRWRRGNWRKIQLFHESESAPAATEAGAPNALPADDTREPEAPTVEPAAR